MLRIWCGKALTESLARWSHQTPTQKFLLHLLPKPSPLGLPAASGNPQINQAQRVSSFRLWCPPSGPGITTSTNDLPAETPSIVEATTASSIVNAQNMVHSDSVPTASFRMLRCLHLGTLSF